MQAELSARYENLFYAADLFAKCVNIPIVCDGANAELTQLLAEKKARDDIVQERDINITLVTNFSCESVWKRDFLIKKRV